MLKSILVYGISTGINRGVSIIYLPILLTILTLSDYGLYTLTLALSQVLLTFVSLNGSIAVMREGAENVEKGFNLLIKYLFITFILTSLVGISTFLVTYTTAYNWIFFAVLLAGLEAKHLLILTQFRCMNYHWQYLIFTIIKVFGFLMILFLFFNNGSTLEKILIYQCLWYLTLFLLTFTLFLIFTEKNIFFKKNVLLKHVVPYSVILIPHGISQWIMSSSDRFIIKKILGDVDLGIYSIAYSIGMILLLINSGIALALPQHLIKNYSMWTKGVIRKKFIILYSLVALILFLIVNFILIIDKRSFSLIDYHEYIGVTVTFIWASLYLLGLYLFYSNYLYYHKKSKVLAIQTFIAAIVNILLTYFMVIYFGYNGAAIATFFAYSLYLYLVIQSAVKIEPKLKGRILKDLWFVPIVVILILVVGYYQLVIIMN